MLLKKLTEAMGPSGYENEIRNVIRSEVTLSHNHIFTDVLGNLFVQQNQDAQGPHIMIDAHMDEIGLMIVHVEENGLLRFRPIGGIDPRVLVSKPVVIGDSKHFGVIGSKPIHLQKPEERRQPLGWDQLYIDIGASSKEDALSVVQPGDVAVFATTYGEMGERAAKAKSFDDRVGCALLVETMQKEWQLRLSGVFAVQEEVGLRGATAAAYRLKPDIAIALEGTVCFDVVDAPAHNQATQLGKGPALTLQDGLTLPDRRFTEFMIATAEKYNIPWQYRRVKGGSNDYGAIQKAREGVIGGAISVPVRYIHAPAQIISLEDYQAALQLLTSILTEIQEGRWHS
ncbi:M42 family metallopeptidase [Alicyclobacillus tolerans]|uniref:M42 family metallopeptidase n=1 Tax=Alicyclobacillus tolerans TaxID=90970 RepID=UPI003B7EFCAC